MFFSNEFLIALADWQNGWKENQEKRKSLANNLLQVTQNLDKKFKQVSKICYRKRFLHPGELEDIFLRDEKDEGVTSWTMDEKYARSFKGLQKPDALSAVIFEHMPNENEIILNICELWKDAEFMQAANKFKEYFPDRAQPLFNFKDSQSEVILTSPLRASQIIAFSGESSSFNQLCEQAGFTDEMIDNLYKEFIKNGFYPDEPRYTTREGAKRIVENSIQKVREKLKIKK